MGSTCDHPQKDGHQFGQFSMKNAATPGETFWFVGVSTLYTLTQLPVATQAQSTSLPWEKETGTAGSGVDAETTTWEFRVF